MFISLCFAPTQTDSSQTNTNVTWKTHTNDLLSSMSVFFTGANNTHDTSAKPGIMIEVACEPLRTCNTDQYAYKGLTAQWMGEAMQVTRDTISGYLQSSAESAADQCPGGGNRTTCGTLWTRNRYDGKTGLGQEMSALNAFLANLAVNSSSHTNVNTTVATTAATATAPTNRTTPSSSTTTTFGKPIASSSRSSSGSQCLLTASWTLSLVIPATVFFMSLF